MAFRPDPGSESQPREIHLFRGMLPSRLPQRKPLRGKPTQPARTRLDRSPARFAVIAAGLLVALLGCLLFGVFEGADEEGGGASAHVATRAPDSGPDHPASEFFHQRDMFLTAIDPGSVTAAKATWLRGDDEVIGVLVGGEARAYPVPMIAYHHTVNDRIAGIPVLVTY